MDHNTLGKYGEDIVVSWLEGHQYQVIIRNYRCRQGEIDIIAKDRGILVFIEVRTLTGYDTQRALASINRKKQKRLLATARHYLAYHVDELEPEIRFDCVGVNFDQSGNIECELLKGAF